MKWITTTLIVAIVLSTNSCPCVKGQDFKDRRQVKEAQERRLDSGIDLATFEARCVASAEEAYPLIKYSNPSDAYVECVDGFVNGTTTNETCATACDGKCCTGSSTGFGAACGEETINPDGTVTFGFTCKGK